MDSAAQEICPFFQHGAPLVEEISAPVGARRCGTENVR
jgi:hypothetical protein